MTVPYFPYIFCQHSGEEQVKDVHFGFTLDPRQFDVWNYINDEINIDTDVVLSLSLSEEIRIPINTEANTECFYTSQRFWYYKASLSDYIH